MGTPTAIVPVVQFLAQLEGAKQYCLSDRTGSSHEFAVAAAKPLMNVEHCSDPGFLRQQVSPNFLDKCRIFTSVLDDLMGAIEGTDSDPAFRFLWDVQISLSTVRMSLGN